MKDKILELMNESNFRPLNIDEIYKRLNLTDSTEFTQLAKTLNSLVDENILTYNSKGEFAPLKFFSMACGIIDVKDAGFAFLDTEYGGIFIPKTKLKSAITYDEVMVKFRIDNKGRYEGEVVRIVKRNTTEVIGTLLSHKGKYIIKPVDSRLNILVFIPRDFNLEIVNFALSFILSVNSIDAIVLSFIFIYILLLFLSLILQNEDDPTFIDLSFIL